jgi:D-arginine dehydrogenase
VTFDFIVLGAGIAGASAGYFLAARGRVLLLEREAAPGYHSTGRSAALYTEAYGNAAIRALTVASGPFYRAPPPGFAETPLLSPRGVMMVASAANEPHFAEAVAAGQRFVPTLRVLTRAEALGLCPVLRADAVAHAFLEPDAMDMDVHAIHQGFLRGLKAQGGTIVSDAPAQGIMRKDGLWQVETPAGRFAAPILVNAAGAWADAVAALAGVAPLGIAPRRRTVLIATAPPDLDIARWPLVADVGESFYFKPEAGRLLISPADETPVAASDVQPEEIDVAEAVQRVEAATTLRVARVLRKWAGLRSFAPDRSLVLGPDPAAPHFVWAAGQGGYGIQTAAAAGRSLAALAVGDPLPDDLAALGLEARDVLPDRLRRAPR